MNQPTHHSQHSTQQPRVEREYEKSGLYPENGKPFRMWALLGVLGLVVASLAGVSALLNYILL